MRLFDMIFFFFKQKTAYEMRISDWSSDVCSSDLEIPNVKIDKEALELAVELMERKAGKFEPEKLKDEYAEAVWELINAKIEHRAPEIVTPAPTGAKKIGRASCRERVCQYV